MHCPICKYKHCINWKRSTHANNVSLIKCLPTSHCVLLSKTLHHWLVFVVTEFVRLHQCFYVVKWIVEHPICCTCNSSSNERNIKRNIVFVNSRRSQFSSHYIDNSEEESNSCRLSNKSWSLSSIQSFDSMLFDNFNHSI